MIQWITNTFFWEKLLNTFEKYNNIFFTLLKSSIRTVKIVWPVSDSTLKNIFQDKKKHGDTLINLSIVNKNCPSLNYFLRPDVYINVWATLNLYHYIKYTIFLSSFN